MNKYSMKRKERKWILNYCWRNLKTTKPKRGVGNPTWIRNPVEAEAIRQNHNQWCRDNGYAIRGKYARKKA